MIHASSAGYSPLSRCSGCRSEVALPVAIFLINLSVIILTMASYATAQENPRTSGRTSMISRPYAGEAACKVKSVEKSQESFENFTISSASGLTAVTKPDANNVYQVYVGATGASDMKCISCRLQPGLPRLNRNKPMISWHPSGRWLIVGVEEDKHDNTWMPSSWQRGFLQSGIWLNIWVTTPHGERWYQITDFRNGKNGPSNGFVGVAFQPDGKRGVWAEIVDGNIFANRFGKWRLYMADFEVGSDGAPSFVNKRDITPDGARWVEPGNFAPDGRHLLLSSDIGMKDAQGQDQFVLDVYSGHLRNLTNSPAIWDEHGLYSPSGSKVVFMSSYPFRNKPDSFKMTSLKTEFMLMDSDGGNLQQLTHFNEPGYAESQPKNVVAAVAQFIGDGSQIFATTMSTDSKFGKTNWLITFEGRCGTVVEASGTRPR